MNQKSLTDVRNQLNTPEENEQEGFDEITPAEATELEGGTANGGCPTSIPFNISCPGNSGCCRNLR